VYAFHPYGALLVVTVEFPGFCETNMDLKKFTKTIAKAIKMSPVIQALKLTVQFLRGVIWQQKQPHPSFVSVWL
jgi:hypothetical protein